MNIIVLDEMCLLVVFFAYPSTLKIEAVSFSEPVGKLQPDYTT